AEDQQGFSRRLGATFVESLRQKFGEGIRLSFELVRQLAKQARVRVIALVKRTNNSLTQRRKPLAVAGDDRQHRNAERLRQFLRVNLVAVALGHVDHVERHESRVAQLQDLRRVVKVALQVRGV